MPGIDGDGLVNAGGIDPGTTVVERSADLRTR